MIARYSSVVPHGDLLFLQKLGEKLRDKTFLHINSTRAGGGVAEILQRMIPIMQELGISSRWEVIEGDDGFFDMTKKVHNAPYAAVSCVISFLMTGHRSVYPSQILSMTKSSSLTVKPGQEMKHVEGVEYEPGEKSLLGAISKSFKRLKEGR
jgi:hypothetical protein